METILLGNILENEVLRGLEAPVKRLWANINFRINNVFIAVGNK